MGSAPSGFGAGAGAFATAGAFVEAAGAATAGALVGVAATTGAEAGAFGASAWTAAFCSRAIFARCTSISMRSIFRCRSISSCALRCCSSARVPGGAFEAWGRPRRVSWTACLRNSSRSFARSRTSVAGVVGCVRGSTVDPCKTSRARRSMSVVIGELVGGRTIGRPYAGAGAGAPLVLVVIFSGTPGLAAGGGATAGVFRSTSSARLISSWEAG